MKKILLTSPAYDKETKFLRIWINEVAEYIKTLSHVYLIRLDQDEATSVNLELALNDHNPSLIMFNGHGHPHKIGGHNGEALVHSNDDSKNHLIGRIVHAVVCSAAHSLGAEMVNNGTKAFIGYNDIFYFWQKGDDTSDPDAKLFLEPALQVSKSLAEGKTVGEAYAISQKMYVGNLLASLTTHDSEISTHIEKNIRNHVLIGDREATI